ncbi:MAG: ribosome biogenesis GTPase Der [Phycisphaerales bacterium]|nr:ribosome biogenesis GTPase Der [Phycisphaerales bacterium]
MPLPKVAIVGRPNVGKSSLLNRLAGRRISIVDPTPGVTRDRVTAIVELADDDRREDDRREDDPSVERPVRLVEFIDTGGYGVYTAEGQRHDDAGFDLSSLTADIEYQIRVATERAQLILFVIDAQDGITPLDETVAALLRKTGCADRVLMVANKVDDESWSAHALEASNLGLGDPVGVSALSGWSMRHLHAAIRARLPENEGADETDEPAEMKLAIVGRRNAGKSTLVNALAGEPRVIVSEIAGTTRDSVDVRFQIEGRSLLAIDTAGVRKRKSFADDIEWYAHHRMLRSIRRADVALLLIDATEEITQVDKKLAQELLAQFKPTVIVINKWDKVADKLNPEQYLDYIGQELPGLSFAPIVVTSAETGEGLKEAVAMAFNLFQQANHRESTARLNEQVHEILAQRGPTSRLGTKANILYISQIGVAPPTIVLVVNYPKLFEGQYERYLMNELRERVPFSEVPIRLIFSQRKRKTLTDLKERR